MSQIEIIDVQCEIIKIQSELIREMAMRISQENIFAEEIKHIDALKRRIEAQDE